MDNMGIHAMKASTHLKATEKASKVKRKEKRPHKPHEMEAMETSYISKLVRESTKFAVFSFTACSTFPFPTHATHELSSAIGLP